MPSAFFLVSDEGPATISVPPSVDPPAGGGPAHDGQTLSADPGNWNATGTPTYTYQWQRCDAAGNNCQDIPGATHSTYTPTAADVGGTVRVVVTATNAAGATSSVSAHRSRSSPRRRSTPRRPRFPGRRRRASRSAPTPATGPAPAPSRNTYQWQRCDAAGNNCQDIAGATGSTYTPSADDVGGTVRVVVDLHQQRRLVRLQPRRRSPSAPPRPPVNTDAPGRRRPRRAGQGPHRGSRRLGGHRPGQLHLPVAALRRQRRQLPGHLRGDRRHLRARRRRTSATRCAPSSPPRPTPAPRRRPARRPRPSWRHPIPTTSAPSPAP